MNDLLGLVVAMLIAFGVEQGLARIVKTVLLSYEPLSGDQTDSAVMHRSLLTPGSADNHRLWAALLGAGLAFWAAWRLGVWWAAAGVVLVAAALAWDLWTWERAAVGVRRVSWRQGWQKSVRNVPVSQVREVELVEKPGWSALGPLADKLGACYLRLRLHTGDSLKLPRTSTLTGRNGLEDMANFLRMQMALADEEKQRLAKDQQRAAKPALSADDQALRRKLIELRRAGGGTPSDAPSDAPPHEPSPGDDTPP
jgi:hypothetical protein